MTLIISIVSLLSWRTDAFYAGGLDPVVVAKSVLSLVSLAMAFRLVRTTTERQWVGAINVSVIAAYLGLTLIGALSAGGFLASAVLAVRVAIVFVTVCCIAMSVPVEEFIDCMLRSLAITGLVLAASGLPQFASSGRLAGGLLPVSPNQIALLLGPPALGCLWRMLNNRARAGDAYWLVGYLVLNWVTGSRTGLVALIVAVVLIVAMAPKIHVATFISVTLAVPLAFGVMYLTPLLGSFFGRGGAQHITTLSSRTIAWDAAFSGPHDFWQAWFGGGLAVRTVAVSGTYWSTQVLDSSWVSSFVQAGYLGIGLLAAWVLITLRGASRSPRPYRSLLVAIAVYAAIRSVLETGLLDAYVLFMVMLVPALAGELHLAPSVASKAASGDGRTASRQ